MPVTLILDHVEDVGEKSVFAMVGEDGACGLNVLELGSVNLVPKRLKDVVKWVAVIESVEMIVNGCHFRNAFYAKREPQRPALPVLLNSLESVNAPKGLEPVVAGNGLAVKVIFYQVMKSVMIT